MSILPMMANFFWFCVLLAPCVSAETSSDFLSTFRYDVHAAARSSQDERATNVVDLTRSEDLADDFQGQGIDTNSDGGMNSELLQVFGGAGGAPAINATDKSGPPPATLQTPPPATTKKLVSVQQPHLVVAGPAAEKPTAPRKPEAHISIQAPHSAKASAKQEVHAPQVTQAVKATPVERMVEHFAQVLRVADVLPSGKAEVTPVQAPVQTPKRTIPQRAEQAVSKRVGTGKRSKFTKTAQETNLHAEAIVGATAEGIRSHSTRAAVQFAAKEVAEQLALAEAAQVKARILDRKAAEERANATVLAKLTAQEALNAGAAAAHSKANELLAKIAKLEDDAERAQVRSAALHSKATLETEEASELMGVADHALNHKTAPAA